MLDGAARQKIADYVNKNADQYVVWQRSAEWDESYKWSVLKELSQELAQYADATEDNVESIMAIYKKHNPSQGSFIRYTYFDDFDRLASDKPAAARFINAMWRADFEVANQEYRKYAHGRRSLGTPGIGYVMAGRNPAKWPLFRGEFYDGLLATLQLSLSPRTNGEKYILYRNIVDETIKFLDPTLASEGYDDYFMSVPAVYGQDFLYFKFFGWNENRLLRGIKQFIAQADGNVGKAVQDADLTSRQYQMQYMGLRVRASFGRGAVARVPWISFGFGGLYDFFPTLLYYSEYKTLILAFDSTRDKAPDEQWKDIDKYQTISEYFHERGLPTDGSISRYNESKVYKAYDTRDELPASLGSDVISILQLYKEQINNLATSGKQDNIDILALVRKFVEYSDNSIPVRNEFKVDYRGAKGRAWITVRDAQRMETTWFVFGKDNVERGGEWDEDRFGLLYNAETGKLYLAHKWNDESRQTLKEVGAESWGNWTVYRIYDPHDIPETFVNDFDVLIEEYNERRKMDKSNTHGSTNIALNTILHGPPGTGKTWNALNSYAKQLLEDQADQQLSAEEVLASSLAELTWWQVVALALKDSGQPQKVADIASSMVVRSYARYVRDRSTNVKPTIWATLQERSDLGSSNTSYRVSGQEYFTKDENSQWSLTPAGVDMANELLSDIPTAAEPQRGADWSKYYRTVTFHQSYSYEEFIEGIRPNLDSSGGDISYEIKPGIFKELSTVASNDPDNKYLLIIDEINRGNIAKIFGELITLLEGDKRGDMTVRLPYSQESFTVPKNLYVLGTMNTADRSIALLDIALRRRFEFVELMPRYDILDKNVTGTGLDLSKLLEQLNQKISIMIDRDHQIGHSYLMKVDTLEGLHQAWYKKIVPLLQEYFYNDWEKLEIVLGKHSASGSGFVTSKVVSFPGDDSMDDTTLHDIHQYSADELVRALKALIVDEEAADR